MGRSNPHPNGCWAARAAEAAGILRGPDGFWQMHRWLFEQNGSFTDASLPVSLRAMGFDPAEFTRVMSSPATLSLVQQDIEEGVALGLHRTPMIFINGVELKGWFTPRALTRSVESLVASNLPSTGPENDRPPEAAEKYIADWRDGPLVVPEPRDPELNWAIGETDTAEPAVSVILFGDYTEPLTAEADAAVRSILGPRLSAASPTAHMSSGSSC